MNTPLKNPYVGPRTFTKEEGHLFFGREREARDLLSLVVSQRLVLFYAQSGAGKSSIINTRLIPSLEDRGFEVFSVGRVSGDLAPEGTDCNVYTFNLMRKLVQHPIDPTVLAKLSLSEFLANLDTDEKGYFYDPELSQKRPEQYVAWRHALVIDQFEELFSTHPEAWEKREDFFCQIAEAMNADPYLWVILVMREDYIASLDPYAHLLPGGLRVRYYMQRLEREAALKAIKNPVEQLRPYAPSVAEKLVDDLCSIKIQKPDGSMGNQPGQYVEPVQLQVVCYSLWEHLPEGGTQITEQDLREVGDVNQSLGRYYAGRVKAVAADQKLNVKERTIREWFETSLITAGGIRNMVLQEPNKKSGGLLDDQVIQALQSDLVRAEKRSGATWYELTHDRLVEPIIADNKAWFEKNSSLLQQQAKLWNDQGKIENLLLTEQTLAEAEEWAQKYHDELTDFEQEYLNACQKRQKQIDAEREAQRRELEMANQLAEEQGRSAKRARIFTFVFLGLFVLALLASVFVLKLQQDAITAKNDALAAKTELEIQKEEAQDARDTAVESARVARLGELAGLALSEKGNYFDLAMLFGIEGFKMGRTPRTEGALLSLLDSHPGLRRYLQGHSDVVESVDFSLDGKTLASAADDDKVILWNVSDPANPSKLATLEGHSGDVNSVAFSPDSQVLASGSNDSTVILWNVSDPANPSKLATLPPSNRVYSVAFSPNGQTLAIGYNNGTIALWNVGDPASAFELVTLDQGSRSLYGLAFSPDGRTLASGDGDGNIILWDMSDPANSSKLSTLEGHSSGINCVAFRPDSQVLASASDDETIILWNVSDPANPSKHSTLEGHNNVVQSVAFSPDGQTLASGGGDYNVITWNVSDPAKPTRLTTLAGHSDWVYDVEFSPNGQTIASGGYDTKVILWDGITARKSSELATVEAHDESVNSVAFSPDGLTLASSGYDNSINLWDVSTPILPSKLATLEGHSNSVNSVAFTPDGQTLASGSDDNTAILWNVSDPSHPSKLATLEGHDDSITSVVFSPDGQILASGSYDNTVILWNVSDPANPSQLATLKHLDAVRGIAFNPDGKTIATGNDDGTIILWDVSDPTNPAKLTTLIEDDNSVNSIAFSPTGEQLATGSYRKVILWDVSDPKQVNKLATLTGHGDWVYSLAFSPDGRRLASGSWRSIILWDFSNTTAPALLTTLLDHDDYVYTIAFGPDSNTIATGSNNIILRRIDQEQMIDIGCKIAGRNFSLLEWIQYFPGEEYRQTCPQWLRGEDFYREFINEELSKSYDSQKVKAALDKVTAEMQNDSAVEDPAAEASRLLSEAINDQFSAYVKAEKFAEALDLLEQAKTLQLDVQYGDQLLVLTDAEIRAGQIEQALPLLEKLNPMLLDLDDAFLLTDVCWDGSLWGIADKVLQYCERAVRLAPDNETMYDHRGLARALTGDISGAIADFDLAIRRFKEYGSEETMIQERQSWLDSLRAGGMPFDQETLEALKSE